MKQNQRFKKLHCLIPEELFEEIRIRGLLPDIDTIVAELLYEKLENEET